MAPRNGPAGQAARNGTAEQGYSAWGQHNRVPVYCCGRNNTCAGEAPLYAVLKGEQRGRCITCQFCSKAFRSPAGAQLTPPRRNKQQQDAFENLKKRDNNNANNNQNLVAKVAELEKQLKAASQGEQVETPTSPEPSIQKMEQAVTFLTECGMADAAKAASVNLEAVKATQQAENEIKVTDLHQI